MAEETKPKRELVKQLEPGEQITNSRHETFEVVRHYTGRYYLVRFLETGALQYVNAHNRFQALDRSKPFVCGVGYMRRDEPMFMFEGDNNRIYQKWHQMISRCYNHNDKKHKNYEGVTVCEEWHNFFNFYNWLKAQGKSNQPEWCLDKDLFSPPDHKYYSPETCCLIPGAINSSIKWIVENPSEVTKKSLHNSRYLSRLLVTYDENLDDRVKAKLWAVCRANGYDPLTTKCDMRIEEIQKQMDAAEERAAKRISELEAAKDELEKRISDYERRDNSSKSTLELFKLMPVRGFVDHLGKVYRLDSAFDLYNILNKVRQDMQAAQRPPG